MVRGRQCPSEVVFCCRAPAAVLAPCCRPSSGALSPLRLTSSLAVARSESSTKTSDVDRSMRPARLSDPNSSRKSIETGSAGKAQEAV
jgi:hypothetical protein